MAGVRGRRIPRELGPEVAGVLGARAAADVAVARGGVVYALTSAIRLDVAVGTGLTRTSPGLVATAGITIGF